MKKILVIFIIIVFTSCHKEINKQIMCDAPDPGPGPTLNFYVTNDSLTGFTDEQLLNLQIMWTSKNNFIPIDSFYYFELNALDYFHSHHKLIITINEITFSERYINDTLDIKNYNFLIVVRNANIIDTISWVDYT